MRKQTGEIPGKIFRSNPYFIKPKAEKSEKSSQGEIDKNTSTLPDKPKYRPYFSRSTSQDIKVVSTENQGTLMTLPSVSKSTLNLRRICVEASKASFHGAEFKRKTTSFVESPETRKSKYKFTLEKSYTTTIEASLGGSPLNRTMK